MAADLNGQSLAIWNNLKPMIDEEIKSQTKGMVQRRKAKVTTAPSLSTGIIGVTEPFGTEYFIPFNTNLTTASVGDFVWVEFMYGATNAFASMYASADTKDYTVGGDLTVIGNEEVNGNTTINGVLDVTQQRRSETLSTAGWYRVASCSFSGSIIDVSVGVGTQQAIDAEVLLSSSSVAQIVVKNSQVSNAISNIRVMLGDGSFHIDIRKTNNASILVSVDVTPHGNARLPGILTAASLTAVADSPAGETELASISLARRTAPLSSPTSLITNGTIENSTTFSYTATQPCWFYYVPVLQAGISGGFTVSLNSVTLASYTSGEAIGVNVAAIPVPMQTGDVLDITQNSNRTSSYRVLTMRGVS